jgi:hypothetical protein
MRVLDPSKPVRVFRNWKHHCWSIMQGGVLCASARQVRLADVQFRVRESGRQRMLRDRRKNVHAYAVGRLVDWVHPDDGRELETLEGRGVMYDAYRFATFVDTDTHTPVTTSADVRLDEAGATYLPLALPEAA